MGRGNSREYLLGRLKGERPDLAAEVEAGRRRVWSAAVLAGIAEPKPRTGGQVGREHEVQKQASDAAVPIHEGVYALEPGVMFGDMNDRMESGITRRGRRAPRLEVGLDRGGHRDTDRSNPHASRAPCSRSVSSRWRLDLPGEMHGRAVCLGHHGHRHPRVRRGFAVDPIRGSRVAFDLQGLDERPEALR